MMAIDCPEYGPEIVFKGRTRQVTSPNVTTAHVAPAGHLVTRSVSRSRQPPLCTSDGADPVRLTASRASVTRAQRALATLRVQKGYRHSPDTCVWMQASPLIFTNVAASTVHLALSLFCGAHTASISMENLDL